VKRRRAEAGQALVYVAVMLPLFFSIVGLAVDGGVVWGARRELQNIADAAARAGAMQIDLAAYRQSAGEVIVLDPASAQETAAGYLAGIPDLTAEVKADQRRVTVSVSRDVPLSFLRIAGFQSVRIGAVAPAGVRHGIEQGNG
jgi:Flp pilus assembly protein TadG